MTSSPESVIVLSLPESSELLSVSEALSVFSLSTSVPLVDGVEPTSSWAGFVRGFWTFFFLASSATVAAVFRLSAFLCNFSAFCRKKWGGDQFKFSNDTYKVELVDN